MGVLEVAGRKKGGARKVDSNFFLGSFVLRMGDCCSATLQLTYGLAAKDEDAGYLSS
jgi:hypothetical protein